MQIIDRDNSSELFLKYPEGYSLFAIDHKKIIIPYQSRLGSEFKLDWNTARIINLSSNEVQIKFPDIYHEKNKIVYDGGIVFLTRKVGASVSPIKIFGLRGVVEIVSNDINGIIAVIGFHNVKKK